MEDMSQTWPARRRRNDEARNHADHHTYNWEPEEDEALLILWAPPHHNEATLVELAEFLGRTTEACRQRYHLLIRGYVTRTTTTRTTTETTTTETRRPAWMDEDGLPEWYR
jgi:hypothetical protein